MGIARRRDIGGITDSKTGIEAQQASSLPVNGGSINKQGYDNPQSAVVHCILNSANSSDDIDFKVQQSPTGSGSWSDIHGAEVTGLDDAKGEATIEVRNLQDYEQYIRVVASGNLASTDVELSASVTLGGAKVE
jgi:hypothetical protein